MKSNKIKIKSIKQLTQFNHLNLYDIQYTDRYKKDKSWIMASRSYKEPIISSNLKEHKPDAVIIVPFHKDKNRIVLIKEFRVTLNDYQLGFPAGLMEKGETIHETASREMMEETGLKIIKFLKTSPTIYSSTGISDESVSIVYVECEGEPSNSGNEGSEDISVLFISRDDASKLHADHSLKFDVKTWLILSMYAKTGKLI